MFFPKFCHDGSKQVQGNIGIEDTHYLCSHSKKCKICCGLKDPLHDDTLEKIKIHKLVKATGKFNFEGCRIVVNKQINREFMTRMLVDYNDLQVIDLMIYGFPVGFIGNRSVINDKGSFEKIKVKNHSGAEKFPSDINKYLSKEASHHAIIGPFQHNPFDDRLFVSPLNSVPKSTPNERRVILDLSFSKDNSAVNDFVPKDSYMGEKVELVFPKIDDFVALINKKGKGCLMYKLDLRRAYRQISICPSDYNLVAFSWKDHVFCDTVLPMGLRSSALICQRVTSAFAFMMLSIGLAVLNYLDDFAGAESRERAQLAFLILRSIFVHSGIEEALDKACEPSEVMIFLGVLFNTEKMTMEITADRLKEIRDLILDWLDKESASLKEIQKLLGKLNFVGSCVRPGRIFVNRILNWLRLCYVDYEPQFVIPEEVKKDLVWWHKFLPLYNGVSLLEYGEWWAADSIFNSDACLSGCGGIFGKFFFHCRFPDFILDMKLHISALELLAVVVCLKLWGSHFKGKKLIIGCDNLAACIVVNSGKARCQFLQKCLREICFLAATFEFQVKAEHVPGVSNGVADSLSRWHLDEVHQVRFRESMFGRDVEETKVEDSDFLFTHDW